MFVGHARARPVFNYGKSGRARAGDSNVFNYQQWPVVGQVKTLRGDPVAHARVEVMPANTGAEFRVVMTDLQGKFDTAYMLKTAIDAVKDFSFEANVSKKGFLKPTLIDFSGSTRLVIDIWKPKALYITENGCSADDVVTADGRIEDTDRATYLRNDLTHLHRAASEGYPIKGYFLWSLMDNYEWADGYSKRFGLHYVDFKTQACTPKLSAEWYHEVISRNAVEERQELSAAWQATARIKNKTKPRRSGQECPFHTIAAGRASSRSIRRGFGFCSPVSI